jgi:orotate phosphoribosyltransferase
LGLQVCAIARLTDLLQYLSVQASSSPDSPDALSLKTHYQAVLAYRERYGVD